MIEMGVGTRIVTSDGRVGTILSVAEHPQYGKSVGAEAYAYSYRMFRIEFEGWRKKIVWMRGAYIEGVIQDVQP